MNHPSNTPAPNTILRSTGTVTLTMRIPARHYGEATTPAQRCAVEMSNLKDDTYLTVDHVDAGWTILVEERAVTTAATLASSKIESAPVIPGPEADADPDDPIAVMRITAVCVIDDILVSGKDGTEAAQARCLAELAAADDDTLGYFSGGEWTFTVEALDDDGNTLASVTETDES